MLATHRRARRSRIPAYLLLALGGLVIWYDPTRNVEPVPALIRWVWASFIVFGGLVSCWGAIKDWWICEFATLPLLVVGFSALVAALVFGEGTTGRLAFACWLGSIVYTMARRWWQLLRWVRAQQRAQKAARESGG